MKKVTLFIASSLFLILTSCQKDNCTSNKGIVGEWLLIEELMDPGDGSGTFQSVTSDKEIKFCDDGTFEGNGDMCTMTNQSSTTHSGTYDTSTETFSPDNCMSMAPMSFQYSVNGDILILTYPCICGCQQKYERI
jgi:hypothetical protein